jgi:hypothetical protein
MICRIIKTKMILAVSGSRLFTDYTVFTEKINNFVNKYGKPIEIVHGGAPGADAMATTWAKSQNIPCEIIRPDYENEEMIKKYSKKVWGRLAPLVRNEDIIKYGTHLIAFPLDETKTGFKSNGTLSAINHAKKANKIIVIYKVEPTL